jgi:hypothetical protein
MILNLCLLLILSTCPTQALVVQHHNEGDRLPPPLPSPTAPPAPPASSCPLLPAPFSTPSLSPTIGTHADVALLQYLLHRYTPSKCAWQDGGIYDALTTSCVREFQQNSIYHKPRRLGHVDYVTAQALLTDYIDDQYHDDGKSARSQGYLYKILIPVHHNRSIETTATFLDGDNNVVFTFPVRAKGHVSDGCGRSLPEVWPNFNNSGDGLNM